MSSSRATIHPSCSAGTRLLSHLLVDSPRPSQAPHLPTPPLLLHTGFPDIDAPPPSYYRSWNWLLGWDSYSYADVGSNPHHIVCCNWSIRSRDERRTQEVPPEKLITEITKGVLKQLEGVTHPLRTPGCKVSFVSNKVWLRVSLRHQCHHKMANDSH